MFLRTVNDIRCSISKTIEVINEPFSNRNKVAIPVNVMHGYRFFGYRIDDFAYLLM
jgi:hypothetical protein